MSAATAKRLPILLKTLLSLAILSGGVALFYLLGESRTGPLPPEEGAPQVVEVTPATTHDRGISFSVDGVVIPFREIEMGAEVAGRVVFKGDNARVGRSVRTGDVLVRIDPRDYQSEVTRLAEDVKQAENNLRELDVQIESARNQLDLAEDHLALQQRFLDREERLAERNATTEVSIDSARRDVLTARTSLQNQTDELRLLQSSRTRLESVVERVGNQLEQARLELERTEIKSPLDGLVIEELAESDGYLHRGDGVVRLRDTSRYDVRCSLRVEQMKWLWETRDSVAPADLAGAYNFPATPVEVVFPTRAGEYIWDGVLGRYDGGGFDPQTRMIPCLVDVDEPLEFRYEPVGRGSAVAGPPSLMAGMFVEVRVQVTPRGALVRIPSSALYPGNRVWVVQEGRLSVREVQVVTYEQDQAIIYADPEGIRGGELVVTSPLSAPIDGADVEVRSRP